MCTVKNYINSIGREIDLLLNGFQTTLANAEYLGYEPGLGYKYKLSESERTTTSFTDIQERFRKAAGKSCYQVSETEVPRVELKACDRLLIKKTILSVDHKTSDKTLFVWLDGSFSPEDNLAGCGIMKTGNLLCLPPSTIQYDAEIFAMEKISGVTGDISPNARSEVESFKEQFALPGKIAPALSAILHGEDLALPNFKACEIPENEFFLLTDNNRPGNREQRDFVCKAISTPDTALAIGPAGSGQTTLTVELIFQLVKRGKRILIVASTNVAVDNILEKLKERPDLACVKRYGDDDSDKLSPDAKKFVLGKSFARTEALSLKERLEKIPECERSEAQKRLLKDSDPKNNGILYDILQENSPIVAGTTFGVALPEMKKLCDKGDCEPPFDYLIIDEASKTTIQEFLVPAALCKHWIVIGDIQQLPPYVDDDHLADNLRICYPSDSTKKREYMSVSDSFLAGAGKDFRQTVLLVEKESDLDAFYYKKYANGNKVLFADAEKAEYNDIRPYAGVIVGSLDSFKSKERFISPRITTVRPARDVNTGRILHEESMQKWMSVACFNREKLFRRFDENEPREWHNEIAWRLIRLFEQRDNDVNADKSTYSRLKEEIQNLIPEDDKEECQKRIRIFEQIYLPSFMELLLRGFGAYKNIALFRGIPKEQLERRLTKLSYQHRCHQEIAQLASDEFYGGKAMKSEHMKGKREWNYTRYPHHNHWADIRGRCDNKNRNEKELDWIERELVAFRDFALHNSKPGNPGGKWTVAALSFYKEQAEELKKRCQKIFSNGNKAMTNKIRETISFCAGSVDAFQGHEADIVFLSYANQRPTCFIEAPNRYNVAITRARYMMVHVGNWTAMSKGQGALGRIVHKLEYAKHSTSTMELNHENRH